MSVSVAIYGNANGTNNADWTASAGNKYDCVSAADSTYINLAASKTNKYQGFTLSSSAIDSALPSDAVIHSVTLTVSAKKSGGSPTFLIGFYSSGSVMNTSATLTTSYANYTYTIYSIPGSGDALTIAAIKALEIQVRGTTASGVTLQVDVMSITVDYATGQTVSVAIRPTGDSSGRNAWICSTGSSRYALVDEASADDADYIYTNNVNLRQNFTLTGADVDSAIGTPNSIDSVQVFFRLASVADGGGPTSVQASCYLSSTSLDSAGSPSTASGTFALFSCLFTTKPGGGAWTLADIKNAEWGIFGGGDADISSNCKISQFYIKVNYVTSSTVSITFNASLPVEVLTKDMPNGASNKLPVEILTKDMGAGCKVNLPIEYAPLIIINPNKMPVEWSGAAYAVTLYPVSDVTQNWATVVPSGSAFSTVDESGSDDADYIGSTSGNAICEFGLSKDIIDYIHSDAIFTSLNLDISFRYWSGSSANVYSYGAVFLKLNGTTYLSSTYETVLSYGKINAVYHCPRPGGGSWSQADLYGLTFGVKRINSDIGEFRISYIRLSFSYNSNTQRLVTRIRIPVSWDYNLPSTKINLPVGWLQSLSYSKRAPVEWWLIVEDSATKPTSILIDGVSNPSVSSNNLDFSAVHHTNADIGAAVKAWVKIYGESGYSTLLGEYTVAISSTANSTRSPIKRMAGVYLNNFPSSGQYYFRISLIDAGLHNTAWSDGVTFGGSGLVREWAVPEFAFRKKITYNNNHGALEGGKYSASFDIQTGVRTIPVKDLCFNDGVADRQVWYFNNKTHICYLTKGDPNVLGNYQVAIISYDHVTETWGTPLKIADSQTYYDTHFTPSLGIDSSGYIYIYYGSHDTQQLCVKSVNPNDSSSFGSPFNITGAEAATYPLSFTLPSGRIMMFFRDRYQYISFCYSDDGGSTWTGSNEIVHDIQTYKYRVYATGVRMNLSTLRVHVLFTIDPQPGVPPDTAVDRTWSVNYIYCDYNAGYAEGYRYWKYADGTAAGTTHSSPAARNDAKAIMVSNSCNNFFSQLLTIDTQKKLPNGSTNPNYDLAFCFFDQKFIETGGEPSGQAATRETYANMAKWNGSSWDIIRFSDIFNTQLRVRRGMITGMMDSVGTMSVFMPVGGLQTRSFLPKVDYSISGSGVTCGTGTTKYVLLDDGLAFTQNDDSLNDWIELTGNGTYVYFTGDDVGSFNGYPYLSVDVYYKDPASSAQLAPSIKFKTGGVVYTGAETYGTTNYNLITYTWKVNPQTGLPWTQAQINDVAFGVVMITSGTMRITKIVKNVRVQVCDSSEWFGSDVVRLTGNYPYNSGDWSLQYTSLNSYIGMPIINTKGDFSNDTIEVNWCSGSDMFYLVSGDWGKMQMSGIDGRLFYGNTEIDRVFDYSNMASSKVRYLIPETVAANATEGPKSLYFYYGNKTASITRPKSDPNNVFISFDNFEEFDWQESINGKSGWTVVNGSTSVYSSPPLHNAGVYSGERSVICTSNISVSGTYRVDKSLPYSLTNAYVEYSLSQVDDQASPHPGDTKFRIWSGSNYLDFGLDGVNNRLFYEINGGSRTVSNAGAYTPVYWLRYSIQANANTVILRCEGNLIFTVTTNLFASVDKISMTGYGNTVSGTYDLIWVTQKLEDGTTHDPVVTVGAEEVGGFYMSASLQRASSQTFLTSFTIGQHYFSGGYRMPVEWKQYGSGSANMPVEWRGWCQHVLNLPVENTHGMAINPGVLPVGWSGWLQTILSLLVEWKQTNEAKITLPIENLSIKQVGEAVPVEWLATRMINNTLPVESLLKISPYTINLPIEETQGVSRSDRLPVEWQTYLATVGKMPVEWRGGCEILNRLPVEFTGGLSVSTKTLVEWGAISTGGGSLPIEWKGSLAFGVALPVEWLRTTSDYRNLVVEWGIARSATVRTVVEWLTRESSNRSIPVEWLQTLSVIERVPVSWDGMFSITMTGLLPVEWTTKVNLSTNTMAVEWTSQVRATQTMAIEYGQAVDIIRKIPTEWIGTIAKAYNLPVEWQTKFSTLQTFLVEYGTKFPNVYTAIPVEWKQTIEALNKLPVMWDGGNVLTTNFSIPVEWLSAIKTVLTMPVESLPLNITKVVLPIEYQMGVNRVEKLPVETLMGTGVSSSLPVDWLMTKEIIEKVSVEWLSKMSGQPVTLPVEWQTSVSGKNNLPIEILSGFSGISRLPVEWSGQLAMTISTLLPVEWRQAIAGAFNLPVENLSTQILEVPKMPVEFGRIVSSGPLSMPIETALGLSASCNLLTEWLQAFDARGVLAVGWTGGISPVTLRMSVEWGERVSLTTGYMPIEYLTAIAAQEKLPVEWLGMAFTLLTFVNMRMLVPGTNGVVMRIPEMNDIGLFTGSMKNMSMKRAELENMITKLSGIINRKLYTGEE